MSERKGEKSTTAQPDGTNDHYIAQFFLRGFEDRSPANRSNFKVIRVDLASGRIERRAVRYTASAAGLYDAPRMDAAGTRLEHIYRDVENDAAPHIRRLIAGDLNLLPSARGVVARFIAHQGSRTETYRRWVDAMFQVAQTQIESYVLDLARQHSPLAEAFITSYIAAKRIAERDGDFLAEQSLKMAADVTPVLAARDWTVIEAPAGSEFILGDQPVLGIRERLTPANADEAVGSVGQMPLSPTRLLWMQRPAVSTTTGGLSSRIATPEQVVMHNRLSLGVSERYIFTRNEDLAEWAVQHRNDNQPLHLTDGSVVEPLRLTGSTAA
ncbi:MAG: DUF4238 domain-containing protein [Dehalococcoidia bacterium]